MTANWVWPAPFRKGPKHHSSKVVVDIQSLHFLIYNSVLNFTGMCLGLCFFKTLLMSICVTCLDTHYNFLLSFKAVLKSPIPSRLIAPAPVSNQGHITIPSKVPGHITVTIETSTTTPSIPVATISGQQVRTCCTIHFTLCFFLSITKGPESCLWSLGPFQQPAPSDAS